LFVSCEKLISYQMRFMYNNNISSTVSIDCSFLLLLLVGMEKIA